MSGAAVAMIALLEDESRVADKLESDLVETPGTVVKIAENYRDFKKLIRSEKFDAASIDWELQGIEKGGEALRLLSGEQPDTAKIVFTQHERRRAAAYKQKADACLIKGTDMARYQGTMEKAVRLGQARQIVRCLQSILPSAVLPELGPGQWIQPEEEAHLREQSCSVVIERILDDNRDATVESLEGVLERRGWWTRFDSVVYSRLNWQEKLFTLCSYAGLSFEDLLPILGCSREEDLRRLFEDGKDATVDHRLISKADELLSVLAYFLRLSDYRPDVFRVLSHKQHFYDGCANKPPWNDVGISGYLRESRVDGLDQTISWIRG